MAFRPCGECGRVNPKCVKVNPDIAQRNGGPRSTRADQARAATFARAPGAEAVAPFGRSNMPGLRPSRNVSASEVLTTSAYLAFMSQRLIAWLACERSK